MYGNQNPDLIKRFEDWWNRDNHGLPLMNVMAVRDGAKWTVPAPENIADCYCDADFLLRRFRETYGNLIYYGDAYANMSGDFGPGSLALYLGSEPRFRPDTVWFEPCIDDPTVIPEKLFREENPWWQKHLALIRALREGAKGDFLVNIPDIIENIDIYAAMRGPVNALYDLMDEPEKVHEWLARIDESYFTCFDAFRDIVKDEHGISSFTAFAILGYGRTAKVQCDFSAMISPKQYREFVLPGLKKQVAKLDHSVYHLDGPDAIKHVPAIMEIEDLDALQWTCGSTKPDGGCPDWFPIYDQVVAAGKALWIQIYTGSVDDWMKSADRVVDRYGIRRLYFHFPWMSQKDADRLMDHAEKYWYEA